MHVQAYVLPHPAPSPLLVKELRAGKHSSLEGMNITASNYRLFLDGNFVWHVVVTLPVEGAPSVFTRLMWPGYLLLHSWQLTPIFVLRSTYLKMVVAMMEEQSCGGLKPESGVLGWGRGG